MIQVGADPVRKVSIIPRGRALGVTLSTPEMDRYGYDAEYLRGRIIGALGGWFGIRASMVLNNAFNVMSAMNGLLPYWSVVGEEETARRAAARQ